MTEALAHGYSSEIAQRDLSNEWMVLKSFSVLVLWMKVASALEGFTVKLRPGVGSKFLS